MVETDPENVYVSVTDTGRGINPEAKSLIFERLYQDPDAIDSSRSGLGLGLFICREIVRLQGGKIWVSSEPGQGSTFSSTLLTTLSPRKSIRSRYTIPQRHPKRRSSRSKRRL